jgi:hypothetical protein
MIKVIKSLNFGTNSNSLFLLFPFQNQHQFKNHLNHNKLTDNLLSSWIVRATNRVLNKVIRSQMHEILIPTPKWTK